MPWRKWYEGAGEMTGDGRPGTEEEIFLFRLHPNPSREAEPRVYRQVQPSEPSHSAWPLSAQQRQVFQPLAQQLHARPPEGR